VFTVRFFFIIIWSSNSKIQSPIILPPVRPVENDTSESKCSIQYVEAEIVLIFTCRTGGKADHTAHGRVSKSPTCAGVAGVIFCTDDSAADRESVKTALVSDWMLLTISETSGVIEIILFWKIYKFCRQNITRKVGELEKLFAMRVHYTTVKLILRTVAKNLVFIFQILSKPMATRLV